MSEKALLLLLFTLVACAADLARGRIPNAWIVFCAAAGLACALAKDGAAAFPLFLAGAALPFLLLYPLFIFRMMGAGDIKLMMAVGGLLGPLPFLTFFVRAVAAGAVYAAVLFIYRVNVKERFRYFFGYLQSAVLLRRALPYRKSGPRKENVPFTVPLLLGAILCVLFPKGVL